MDAIAHFKSVVPGFMAKLLRDFPELDVLDAAAIFGNLGHESGGLATLQEIKPIVKGSAGGYGWPQWTGPRRRAYEAYCKRNRIDPASDLANYKYLFLELKGIEGSEGAAIRKTMAAQGLEGKVKAFELAFLRAHKDYKHYASRLAWANRALEAWQASPKMLIKDPFGDVSAPLPDMPVSEPVKNPPAQSVEKKAGVNVAGALVAVLTIAAVIFAVWFIGFRR